MKILSHRNFLPYGIYITVAINYTPAKKDGIVERSEAPNITPSRLRASAEMVSPVVLEMTMYSHSRNCWIKPQMKLTNSETYAQKE